MSNIQELPARRSNRQLTAWAVFFTAAIEVLTCVLRYGCRLESSRDTASTIGVITCGLRIHHSYIGALMILLACWFWDRFPPQAWWGLAIGLGLFLSDLIHHFLVLWPIEGSPQFDFWYNSSFR